VKIDRSLVRSIENSGTRRALLSTMVNYATHIGAAVIAEGLETRDELATVIEVGAPYGQGYLLGKPNDGFKGLRAEMRDFVAGRLAHRVRRNGGLDYSVDKIARRGIVMPPNTLTEQVATKFTKNSDIESIVIVDEERIEGLVMRDRLEQTLAQKSDLLQRPISELMDRRPLVVEADRPVDEVAGQNGFRREMRFHDDILVARGGLYVGVLPMRALFEAVTSLSINRAKYNNPLTDLPGPVLIEQACNERLNSSTPTIAVHADINHFRAFNRLHGLPKGDEALCALARILEDFGARPGFLGHIGGDDFLLLLDPATVTGACEEIIRRFELALPELHTAVELRQGYADAKDSQGNPRHIPLMSLRLTGVDAGKHQLRSYAQVINAVRASRKTAQAAQTTEGSSFAIE
jgi:GGDEF domain-containing protein